LQQKRCCAADAQVCGQGNNKAKHMEEKHVPVTFCLQVIDLVAMQKEIPLKKETFINK